ncbi:hypothetical protein NL676_029326 [Syzygium grande]|nr:hypothetical protein NL676_029326 [Syzygium grande]
MILGNFPANRFVAQIQLEELLQVSQLPQYSTIEVVRVDVEEGEVLGNVIVVEVDVGDGADAGVVGGGGAEYARLVADEGADPIGGEVARVGYLMAFFMVGRAT